ncbi:hypothetical protein [Methanohalobium sp.]|uniref:hypothetical protein n=1 Tax=Methanohalobium sp. TaxID=2837493 RepID=UPI0025CD1087|nr:hypothetical protein [Methanohalobium sp.]
MVWKFNVLRTNAKGGVEKDITFGNNSYYWIDYTGLHFHFGSLNEILKNETVDATIWFIANVIDFTCPLATKQSSTFADKLIQTIKNESGLNSNEGDGTNIFISWKSLAMITEHNHIPELDNIKVYINEYCYNIKMQNR